MIQADSFEEVLAAVGVAPTDWDFAIVSDGSGTTWEKPCGWASVLLDKRTFARTAFSGSFSCGTNSLAEMFGVLHPLLYLVEAVRPNATTRPVRVHALTDAENIANQINGKSNGNHYFELWQAISALRQRNYEITAHWIPRDTIDLNKLAHDVANDSRLAQSVLNKRHLHDKKIFDANPD